MLALVFLCFSLLSPSSAELNWQNISIEAICEDGNRPALISSGVALMIIGLVFAIAGHKIVRVIAFIFGAGIGFTLTYIIIDRYISASFNFWGKIGISAGFGLLLGCLAAFLITVATALLGFGLGVFICSLVLATPLGSGLFSKAEWAPLVSLGLSGLAGLVLALILDTYVLMVATALLGSFMIGFSIDCVWLHSDFVQIIPQIIQMSLPPFDSTSQTMYFIIGGVALGAIVGTIAQLIWYFRANRQRHHDEEQLRLLG